MTKNTMLKDNSHFAGYTIAGKMSTNHDGDREVYHAVDTGGQEVALIVYNLDCELYYCEKVSRKRVADFIEEINISERLKSDVFPKVLGKGIEKVGRKRLAWMAKEYRDGNSLTNEIMMQGSLSTKDSIQVAIKLTTALRELSGLTNGGGHYNIRPENIIVDYDHDDLKGVYIVGMTNAGQSFHGKPPFDDEHLSNLYRAPETTKGIFNQMSDVYSLGMLMLVMMLGKEVFDREGKKYIIPSGEYPRCWFR